MAASPTYSRRSASSTSSDGETMIGPFKKLESIGKGSFAMVYRGVHIKKRSLVAIKSVNLGKLNRKLKDNLLSEITILRDVQHPHIVALIDCQESPIHMHIVMEFCELGDLSSFIKKRASLGDHPATAEMMQKYPNPRTGGLNEVIVRHFLKQIASALEFLRAKNYVHRDLKPQNLLLNPSPLFYHKSKPEVMPLAVTENSLVPAAGLESLPMLKVADFGFARLLPSTSLAETLCGSPLYMAPEILRYEKYDAKADLWSVGTVLHEMMFSKPPFRAQNHVELLRRIEKQDDKIKFPDDVDISRGMKSIIRGLLKKTPTERMSFESFFDHEVVREEIPGLVGDDLPRQAERDPEKMPEPEPERPISGRRASKQPISDIGAAMEEALETTRDDQSRSPRDRGQTGTSPNDQASRPSSARHYSSTPPRPTSGNRRYSNQALQPPEPTTQPTRERRPTLTSNATAPARQNLTAEKAPNAAAVVLGRRNSRNAPSPSSSMLREHLERERNIQRTDERVQRRSRDYTTPDNNIDADYVVIDKKVVEVNAFADELDNRTETRRPGSRDGTMVRRATVQGAPNSTTGAHTQSSKAVQIASGRRPDATHHRTGSYERYLGRSPGSARDAISGAINQATKRLWAFGTSPPFPKGPSPPQGYGAFPAYPTAQSSILVIGDGGKPVDTRDEDAKTVMLVEALAERSHVVYGFAGVKFEQLLGDQQDQGLGILHEGVADKADNDEAADDDVTDNEVIVIAEEALVLYVKSLSLLAKAMDIAGSWWGKKTREAPYEGTNQRSNANRLNHVVQWVRTRFNECVERSEYAGRRLVEAQKRLPPDHPHHPNNHPLASSSATSIGTSKENIILTTGVTAEQLLYNRALEMSRAAAVDELVNENLAACELKYATAISMLEALLDSEEGASSRSGGVRKDEPIDGLEAEDRQAVLKLIESMKTRLRSLRKKLEFQKAQKRASVSNTHDPSAGAVPARSSPR